MFRKIRNELFWTSAFDERWKLIGIHCARAGQDTSWQWSETMELRRCYWRVNGKRGGYAPEVAAFNAIIETADEIFKSEKKAKVPEEVWMRLAAALASSAPVLEAHPGRYTSPDDLLREPWLSLYKRVQEAERKKDQVLAIRFGRDEIEEAWLRLVGGSVSPEAKRVWANCQALSSVHKIASQAALDVTDALRWLIVFRTHGLVEEFAEETGNYFKGVGRKVRRDGTASPDVLRALNALECE